MLYLSEADIYAFCITEIKCRLSKLHTRHVCAWLRGEQQTFCNKLQTVDINGVTGAADILIAHW